MNLTYGSHFLKWVTKNIDLFHDIQFLLDVPVYIYDLFSVVSFCIKKSINWQFKQLISQKKLYLKNLVNKFSSL